MVPTSGHATPGPPPPSSPPPSSFLFDRFHSRSSGEGEGDDPVQFLDNPMRASPHFATRQSNNDGDDWDHHHDEDSGKPYFSHRLSGKVVWNLPTDGGDSGFEDGGDGGYGEGGTDGGYSDGGVDVDVADDSDDGDGKKAGDSKEDDDDDTRRQRTESEWRTHEDEESGKMYYEHRLSGRVVWDLAGASADADMGVDVDMDVDADVDVDASVVVGATAGEAAAAHAGDHDQWEGHHDEESGHRYFAHRTSGAVAWSIPEDGDEGDHL